MDTSTSNHQRCLGCSNRTIEQLRVKPNNSKNFQRYSAGLVCSRCGRLLCISCVKSFHASMKSKIHDFHSDCQLFISGINKYHQSTTIIHDPEYIGHCCVINMHYENKKRKLSVNYSESISKSISDDNNVGGCLVIPEYNLIISHDESVMDVIGLGPDDNISPCWHYVVDELNSCYLSSCGVEPILEYPVT